MVLLPLDGSRAGIVDARIGGRCVAARIAQVLRKGKEVAIGK